MKHWNFFPCLFLLLAVFWWRFVDLSQAQMQIEQSTPKIEIQSPLYNKPLELGVPMIPPFVLPDSFCPPENSNDKA